MAMINFQAESYARNFSSGGFSARMELPRVNFTGGGVVLYLDETLTKEFPIIMGIPLPALFEKRTETKCKTCFLTESKKQH